MKQRQQLHNTAAFINGLCLLATGHGWARATRRAYVHGLRKRASFSALPSVRRVYSAHLHRGRVTIALGLFGL